MLRRLPSPTRVSDRQRLRLGRSLASPLRNRAFRRLLIYYGSWAFGAIIADPFYSVFMLRDLEQSFAVVGVLNFMVLAVGVLGYRFWGSMCARFGSKMVLALLMVPRALLPLVWAAMVPENATVMLSVVMVLNGIVYSGLTVAINALLFGTVPNSPDRPGYFAAWAFVNSIIAFSASAVGGLLSRVFAGVSFEIAGMTVSHIRLVFVASSVLLIPSVFLLRGVTDSHARPVAEFFGQVRRGNAFSYAYNLFAMSLMRQATRRARALRRLGRSGSPFALDRLVGALDDALPEIREQAAKGLGEARIEEAVEPLVRELGNTESDVRAEAAASLGRIGSRRGVAALVEALESPDSRVAISAARALGEIGGETARRGLYRRLVSGAGRDLTPTLIESLSRLGDVRVVDFAFVALREYSSPVLKLQLLNAVCRSAGGGNLFYELLTLDVDRCFTRLHQIVRASKRRHSRLIQIEERIRHRGDIGALSAHFENGRYFEMIEAAQGVLGSVRGRGRGYRAARSALRHYSRDFAPAEAIRPEVFAVVCLGAGLQDAERSARKTSR